MTSTDWAVAIWTVMATIGVLFSGTMITSRWRRLRRLYRYAGNGDRLYRIYLAWQDIRRSVVRHLAFAAALLVGSLFVVVTHTDWIEQPPRWLMEHWVWLLSILITLLTVNEVWDRWALIRIDQLPHKAHHSEGKGHE